MKALCIAVLTALCMSGCVRATYNEKTGELSYTRFGNQEVSDFYMEKEGSKCGFAKSESRRDKELYELMNRALVVAEELAKSSATGGI